MIHTAAFSRAPVILLVFRRFLAGYSLNRQLKETVQKLANPSDQPGRLEVKRLLCVDDSPDMLEILVDLLQPQFTIVGALSCGASVLEEAANLNPDIILLDVDLGDMSGFAVAEQLRNSGCPARVVFLSVHESIDFIRAAKDLGAAGYVCKSQITRDLVKTLHSASQPPTERTLHT